MVSAMIVVGVMMMIIIAITRMTPPLHRILVICRVSIQGFCGYIFANGMMAGPNYDVIFFINLTIKMGGKTVGGRNQYDPHKCHQNQSQNYNEIFAQVMHNFSYNFSINSLQISSYKPPLPRVVLTGEAAKMDCLLIYLI